MSLRAKLIATYLVVALLVPVLGGIAMSRVGAVEGSIGALGRDAVPTLTTVKALEQSHADQSAAVLAYLVSGAPEERQYFGERSRQFERDLQTLLPDPRPWSRPDETSRQALMVAGERTAFVAAAEQVIGARVAIDRELAALQGTHAGIVQELGLIRRRLTGGTTEVQALPPAQRREHGELLLSTSGMLEVVQTELNLATWYALRQDEALRHQFESAGLGFSTWLQLANAAGTAEDRQVLARVQGMFYQELEPRARALFLAAEFSARARAVFTEANGYMVAALGRMALQSATITEAASGDAETAVDHAGLVVISITLLAFLLAGALGLWFSGTITRPILRLRSAADRLSRGDVSNLDIPIASNDEVGDLTRSFRRMALSVRILMSDGADAEQGAMSQ